MRESNSQEQKSQLKLRADAVLTISVHHPEPKRRKGPAVRATPETSVHVHAVASDNNYCPKTNFGIAIIFLISMTNLHTPTMPCQHFRLREEVREGEGGEDRGGEEFD